MGNGGNVIDELKVDHREVEEFFEQIWALPSGEHRRRELADRLTVELVRHSVAAEEYFYPVTRRHVDDGDDLVDQELEEHARLEQLLKELEGCPADDSRFEDLVTRLQQQMKSHIEREEHDLFPRLAESCPADDLARLGEKVRSAKAEAPTRPHPSASDAPSATEPAPGAGLVDRAREALSGRSAS